MNESSNAVMERMRCSMQGRERERLLFVYWLRACVCWCIRKKQGQLSRMFPPTRSQRQLPTHWQCHRWFIILLALCQICHSVSLRLCLVLHFSEFSTMDFHSFFIGSKTENISILYLCTVKTPGLRVVRRLFYEIYIFVEAWCSLHVLVVLSRTPDIIWRTFKLSMF